MITDLFREILGRGGNLEFNRITSRLWWKERRVRYSEIIFVWLGFEECLNPARPHPTRSDQRLSSEKDDTADISGQSISLGP
jgi:hypothetical protein